MIFYLLLIASIIPLVASTECENDWCYGKPLKCPKSDCSIQSINEGNILYDPSAVIKNAPYLIVCTSFLSSLIKNENLDNELYQLAVKMAEGRDYDFVHDVHNDTSTSNCQFSHFTEPLKKYFDAPKLEVVTSKGFHSGFTDVYVVRVPNSATTAVTILAAAISFIVYTISSS